LCGAERTAQKNSKVVCFALGHKKSPTPGLSFLYYKFNLKSSVSANSYIANATQLHRYAAAAQGN
jgi:hypothetical protein